jgi:tetratricopeptide (TPR) repeat protein
MDEKDLQPQEQKTRILNSKTPYETLFLPTTASAEQAKAQYFKLVKRYSPEREEETFRKIRKAYEDLRSPARKAAVDVMLFSGPVDKLAFKGIPIGSISQVKLNREIDQCISLATTSSEAKTQLLSALKQRAVLFGKHGMWNEALKDLDQIEEIEGPTDDVRNNRIHVLCQQAHELAEKGLYADAAHRWRRALRLAPMDYRILHNLAVSATLLINKEEETKYWVDTLQGWHRELSERGESDYIKHLIVETHKRFGGRFLAQTGDENLRVQLSKGTATGDPRLVPHMVSDPAKDNTSEKEPAPPGTPQAIGLDAYKQRNWEGAIASFEVHLKEHPDDVTIMDKLAWACLQGNHMNRAFSIWQKMVQDGNGIDIAKKSFVQAKVDTARSLRQRRMVNPALVQLKDALKVVNDSYLVYQELGEIYFEREEWVNASYYFEKAVELNPNDRHSRQQLRTAKTRARSYKGG